MDLIICDAFFVNSTLQLSEFVFAFPKETITKHKMLKLLDVHKKLRQYEPCLSQFSVNDYTPFFLRYEDIVTALSRQQQKELEKNHKTICHISDHLIEIFDYLLDTSELFTDGEQVHWRVKENQGLSTFVSLKMSQEDIENFF